MNLRILSHMAETANSEGPESGKMPGRLAPISKAFSLIRPYGGTFLIGMGALAIGSAITVALPEAGRRLLDSPLRETLLQDPVPIAVIVTGVLILQALSIFVRVWAFGRVGTLVVKGARTEYFGRMIGDPAGVAAEGSGVIASRLDSDAGHLHEAVATKLPLFVRYGFQALASLGFMIVLSAELSVVAGLSVLFLVATAVALSERLRKSAVAEQSQKALNIGWAREVLESIPAVRAFHAQSFVAGGFSRRLNDLLGKSRTRVCMGAVASALLMFINSAGIVIGVSYGISLVGSGELSWSEFATFAVYATMLTISCALCINGFVELVQSLGAATSIFPRNQTPVERTGPIHAAMGDGQSGGLSVECDDITFGYGDMEADAVLSNVTISIPAGSTAAIMGPSGAGKSTLVNLLLGFTQPSSGSVRLDGVEPWMVVEEELRSAIAWAPHEPILLGVSIGENLRIANPAASDEELHSALEKVGLARLIRQCPDGLETEIGERGGGLSSGQRQRLALARLFLRRPRLVILDEATAALDVDTERKVQEALRAYLPEATFIVVSHRLSSVRGADQVIVIDKGSVVRQGSYADIIGSEGLAVSA